MLHTRKCGEIADKDFGTEQTLCGWLQDTRNLGGIAFLQLRDITGIIQLTLLKKKLGDNFKKWVNICLLYTSPSPRDNGRSRMPSCA